MTQESMIDRPPADSANGRLNGYMHHCNIVAHSMYYAACLARIDAVNDKAVRLPQDWQDCAGACRTRTCQSAKMREDELAQGKAIYFIERSAIQAITHKAREWIDSWKEGVEKVVSKPKPKTKSSLDGMVDASKMSLGDALNAALGGELSKPIDRPTITALPGETPLQMARRLAAQKGKSA